MLGGRQQATTWFNGYLLRRPWCAASVLHVSLTKGHLTLRNSQLCGACPRRSAWAAAGSRRSCMQPSGPRSADARMRTLNSRCWVGCWVRASASCLGGIAAADVAARAGCEEWQAELGSRHAA